MEFADIMTEIDQVSQLSDSNSQENQQQEEYNDINQLPNENKVQENNSEQILNNKNRDEQEKSEQELAQSQLKQSNISVKSTQNEDNPLSNSATYMAIIKAQDDQIMQMKQQLQQVADHAKEEAKKELREQYNMKLKQKLVEQFKQELLQEIPTEIKKIVLQQTSDEEIETLAFDVLQKYKNEYNKQMEQQLQIKYQQIEKIRAQAEDKSKLKQQEIEFKKKIDALNRQIEQNNSKNLIKVQKIQLKCDKLQEEAQQKEQEAAQLREQTTQQLEQIKELTQQLQNSSQLESQVQLLQEQVQEYKQLNEKLTYEFNNQKTLLQKYQQQIEQFSNSIHNQPKEKQVTFKDDVNKDTMSNSKGQQGIMKKSVNKSNPQSQQSDDQNESIKLILNTKNSQMLGNNQLKQQQAVNRMQNTTGASFLEQMKSKYLYQNSPTAIKHENQAADGQLAQEQPHLTYNFKSNLLNNLSDSQQQIQESANVLKSMVDQDYVARSQEESVPDDEVMKQLNAQNEQQQLYYELVQKISFVNKNQKLHDLVTRAFAFLQKIFEDNETDFFYRKNFIEQNIRQNEPKESLYAIKAELQKQNSYKQQFGDIIYLIKMREDIKEQNDEDLDAVQQIAGYIRHNGDVLYRGIPYSKIMHLEGIDV